nr:glycosyltransferase family 9 protein [Paraglaciecola sp. MB-3u-78]
MLVDKTSLKSLLALLKLTHLMMPPDTEPAHMAMTVGTPFIGLFDLIEVGGAIIEQCSTSFIPWITDCDLLLGMTTEFTGMFIELIIIFGGFEALRRRREYKKYKKLRENTRQLFSTYSRNIVTELKSGIEVLEQLKSAEHQQIQNSIANNPFQRVQELYTNFSRDLFDRYHLLDLNTIHIGELVLSQVEQLMNIWCIAKMIDADSELSWKANTKESFTKSLTNDMTKIEDITAEISLIKTILSSIKFRRLSFAKASKLIASKIKQIEEKTAQNL